MRKEIILLLILLLFPAYAQTIKCTLETTPKEGCLIGVYKVNINNEPSNSHAAICSEQALGYYICKIIAEDGTEIPIEFTINCNDTNKTLFYLYKPDNSHVSLDPTSISICLSDYFASVIEIGTGTPILGLYKKINSHIQGFSGNYNISLSIKDYTDPRFSVSIQNNSYITLPMTLYVNFTDDNYLYLCKYEILESGFSKVIEDCKHQKYYLEPIVLTSDICDQTCTIKLEAIDLAGNKNSTIYKYAIRVSSVNIESSLETQTYWQPGSYDATITVENTGTVPLNNVTLSAEGCDDILNIWYKDKELSQSVDLGKLNVGESKELPLSVEVLKTGRCNLELIVNATEEDTGKPVEFKELIKIESAIAVKPFNILLVSEKYYILPIALIALILLLW